MPWTQSRKKTNAMKVRKLRPYSIEVKHDCGEVKKFSYLLLSDVHWDNPHCNRALLQQHLDAAKARGAGIMIFGDFFCAMQGKYDPRGAKNNIRPEHDVSNYFDALVDNATEYLLPYRENILLITPGNHETSILKRQETDLTGRLCAALGVERGTYSGWVMLRYRHINYSAVKNISYHHGYGGGGPVTKDVIQASRKSVYLPDAHIVVSGHTHDRWIFPIQRVKLNKGGEQMLEEQLHLKLGTYKDEFTDGGGWAVERGMPPKSMGGVWLNTEFTRKKEQTIVRMSAELT